VPAWVACSCLGFDYDCLERTYIFIATRSLAFQTARRDALYAIDSRDVAECRLELIFISYRKFTLTFCVELLLFRLSALSSSVVTFSAFSASRGHC
jgi:hypothetical protein